MAATGGDSPDLRASLERFRPRVRRHVRSLVRNRADAEDLTQETFLRAHRRLAALQDPEAMGAWLCRIAHDGQPGAPGVPCGKALLAHLAMPPANVSLGGNDTTATCQP